MSRGIGPRVSPVECGHGYPGGREAGECGSGMWRMWKIKVDDVFEEDCDGTDDRKYPGENDKS